jgi:hypothetical protein
MALTVPTGPGEVFGQINAKLYENHAVFQAGLIEVISGFQDKYTLPISDSSYGFQAYSEDPSTFIGEFKTDDVTMQLEIYMMLMKFNPKNLEKYWRPYQPTGTLNFTTLPPNVQAVMLGEIAASNKNFHALNDFVGSKVGGTFYDGWLTKIKSGGSDYSGGTNGAYVNRYSKARLIVEATGWSDVKTKLTNTKNIIKTDADLRIAYNTAGFSWIMDPLSYEIYADQQKAQASKGVDFTQAGVKSFDGKPIVIQTQLTEQVIIGTYGATSNSNLVVGQDDKDKSDGISGSVQVDKINNVGDLFFAKANMKRCTEIRRPEHVICSVAAL